MENWLDRTQTLIGKEKLDILKTSHITVLGLGGVGSFAAEAIVRSGVGEITLVDSDTISITNLNRQLLADTTTIGKLKVEVAKTRYLSINPDLKVHTFSEFYGEGSFSSLVSPNCNYIIDAIDTVHSKLDLIKEAKEHDIPIISCMGTGNKLNPSRFEITDISKTSVCPLAKVMRKELKQMGIHHVKVLYSREEKIQTHSRTPASICFVPSVAGLQLAGAVITELIK